MSKGRLTTVKKIIARALSMTTKVLILCISTSFLALFGASGKEQINQNLIDRPLLSQSPAPTEPSAAMPCRGTNFQRCIDFLTQEVFHRRPSSALKSAIDVEKLRTLIGDIHQFWKTSPILSQEQKWRMYWFEQGLYSLRDALLLDCPGLNCKLNLPSKPRKEAVIEAQLVRDLKGATPIPIKEILLILKRQAQEIFSQQPHKASLIHLSVLHSLRLQFLRIAPVWRSPSNTALPEGLQLNLELLPMYSDYLQRRWVFDVLKQLAADARTQNLPMVLSERLNWAVLEHNCQDIEPAKVAALTQVLPTSIGAKTASYDRWLLSLAYHSGAEQANCQHSPHQSRVYRSLLADFVGLSAWTRSRWPMHSKDYREALREISSDHYPQLTWLNKRIFFEFLVSPMLLTLPGLAANDLAPKTENAPIGLGGRNRLYEMKMALGLKVHYPALAKQWQELWINKLSWLELSPDIKELTGDQPQISPNSSLRELRAWLPRVPL